MAGTSLPSITSGDASASPDQPKVSAHSHPIYRPNPVGLQQRGWGLPACLPTLPPTNSRPPTAAVVAAWGRAARDASQPTAASCHEQGSLSAIASGDVGWAMAGEKAPAVHTAPGQPWQVPVAERKAPAARTPCHAGNPRQVRSGVTRGSDPGTSKLLVRQTPRVNYWSGRSPSCLPELGAPDCWEG